MGVSLRANYIQSSPLDEQSAADLYDLKSKGVLPTHRLYSLLEWIVGEAEAMQGCQDPDAIDDLRELVKLAGDAISNAAFGKKLHRG